MWIGIAAALFALLGASIAGCDLPPEPKLLTVVARKDLATVETLLAQRKVDVNYRGPKTGTTALEVAVGRGNEEMTRVLSRRGADPNVKNSHGVTPLRLASYEGRIGLVRALLEAGAELDTADRQFGYTPIAAAAWKGHAEVVAILAEAGADQRLRTTTVKSLYHLALENDHVVIAKGLSKSP